MVSNIIIKCTRSTVFTLFHSVFRRLFVRANGMACSAEIEAQHGIFCRSCCDSTPFIIVHSVFPLCSEYILNSSSNHCRWQTHIIITLNIFNLHGWYQWLFQMQTLTHKNYISPLNRLFSILIINLFEFYCGCFAFGFDRTRIVAFVHFHLSWLLIRLKSTRFLSAKRMQLCDARWLSHMRHGHVDYDDDFVYDK